MKLTAAFGARSFIGKPLGGPTRRRELCERDNAMKATK